MLGKVWLLPATLLAAAGFAAFRVGSHPTSEQLCYATASRDYQRMIDLLLAGCDVNGRLAGETALTTACENDDPTAVKLLLAYHADVNESGALGIKPLDCAQSDKVRRLLIRSGAVSAEPHRSSGDAAADASKIDRPKPVSGTNFELRKHRHLRKEKNRLL